MFCPNCKCEYIAGIRECSECGVALVDALETPETNPREDDGLVSIWAGDDPGECAAVKEAFGKAGIPFKDQAATGYFIFPSMRLKIEIWVSSLDRDKAEKVLLDLEGRIDPAELTPDEIEAMALPISDDADPGQDTPNLSDTPHDWDDEVAVREVWSGEKEDFAGTLAACLREIGIPSHKLGESGHWRLLVRSEQESRAREIVREVVEASPPE
jgi:hypothetical protein